MKTCRSCGQRKEVGAFAPRRRICVTCRALLKAAYNTSAAGRRSSFASGIKAKYGMTVEEFAWVCHAQQFRCAICRDPLDFGKFTHVDHDHKTGVVRSLLCTHCNRGLGAFRDSAELMSRAIQYLSTR